MVEIEVARYHRDLFNGELKRLKEHPYFGDVFKGGEPDYDRLVPRYRKFVSSVRIKYIGKAFEKQKKVLLLRSLGKGFVDIGAETGYAPGSLSEAHRNGLSRLANYWRTPQILDGLYANEYFETFMKGSWPVDFDLGFVKSTIASGEAARYAEKTREEMIGLGLPQGILNLLGRQRITTVDQLRAMTDSDLLEINLLGNKRLTEIRKRIPVGVSPEQMKMELYPAQGDSLAELGLPKEIVVALKNEGISRPDELEAFLLEIGQKLADYRNRR